MADSNKIVQSLALDVVGRIASGMGKPFDKLARIFAGPVAGVLADQKVNIRTAGVATLTAMADAAGLESLLGGLDKPLEAQNPLLRKELLGWLEGRFEDPSAVPASVDLKDLAGPIISCLEDRSADVRKSAIALLPVVVARAGYNFVLDKTSSLKPASRSTVVPLIEAARGSAPAAPPPTAAAAPTKAPAKPTVAPSGTRKVLRPGAPAAPPPPPADDPPARAPAGIRPRPSFGSRAKAATPVSRASPAPSAREAPFRSSDPDAKRVRAAKETGSLKWVVDGTPRPDQVEALFHQMSPNTAPDLLALLFSKDHNSERDFAAALSTLDDCARDTDAAAAASDLAPEELRARLVANVDVVFKYVTLRIGLTSTTITVKCLDVVEHFIAVLDAEGHKLSDYEAHALLLSLISKVRFPSSRLQECLLTG